MALCYAIPSPAAYKRKRQPTRLSFDPEFFS